MEEIKKYYNLLAKVNKKDATERATISTLKRELEKIDFVAAYKAKDENTLAHYKVLDADIKKHRSNIEMFEEMRKSVQNDCMRYASNVLLQYMKENIEKVDGMHCRLKAADKIVKELFNDDFSLHCEHSGMYYALYCKHFEYRWNTETLYFTNDGYNFKTGKFDAYFCKKNIEEQNFCKVIGADNIEKTVKQAFKDKEKLDKMIKKFEAEAKAIKGKYSSNSIYYIFERKIHI